MAPKGPGPAKGFVVTHAWLATYIGVWIAALVVALIWGFL